MIPLDVRLRRLAGGAFVTLLCFVAMAAELAPAGPALAPDLLFCVVVAVAARRPEIAPAPLVFALGLVRDLLAGAPVGLGALALTLAAEAARVRSRAVGRRGVALEAPLAAALVVLSLLGQAAVLWVAFAPVPPMEDLAVRGALTLAAYPLVALALARPLRRRAGREAAS